LEAAFFIDAKVGWLQSGHMPPTSVRDRHVENDEVDIDSDRVLPLVPALLSRDEGSP
jgi:hypothetical protein